ncbi:sensor histidine kinase [Actinoplanes sp. CA-142083]|uniref:sensor histidine kinase n=1 Tax=Actinoplanes sp. CA-142083 TaxID=3239903 RepID=UPI003D929C27
MDRTPRLSRHQWIALDGLAAIAYLLVFAPAAVLATDVPAGVAVPLVVAVGAPVAARRLWPVGVFVVVLAASVAALALGVLTDPFVAAAFALYPVALGTRHPRLPIKVTGAIAVAILVVASVVGTPHGIWPRLGTAVLGAGFLAGAWTAGQVVRARRAEATRTAAEQAAQAVTEERLRIARELHDVVAHSMSVITVQAGTANHVIATHPTEAQKALRVIESTSRTALTEMRQLLGVLRSGGDGVEFAPLPGPSGLPTLVRRAEEAGVQVELDLRGTESLPAGPALSVYRIVQEALTNVVRHAAPARCEITVIVKGGEVTIDVTDDGRRAGRSPAGYAGADTGEQTRPRMPPDRARTGHGLIGMRERVLMYGGSFRAGPRPEGGFAVSARLPLAP